MSRFDLILIIIAALILGTIGVDVWLIVHDQEQITSGVWTLLTAVSGGEVVTFSIYRMVKRVNEKLPNSIIGKHSLLKELEDENNDKQIHQ